MAMTAASISPRAALWALRVLWAATAVLGGFALSGALDDHGGAGATVVTVLWWLAVAAVMVALVVPTGTGLAVTRTLVPTALPALALVLGAGGDILTTVAALVIALVATVVALSAEVGEAFVQAAAYGAERRFPLRLPAAVAPFLGLAWMMWSTAAVLGLVFLAAEKWVLGVVFVAVAAALAVLLVGRGRLIARRWLVLVPAGVVVHDPLVLGETLMVPRPNVASAHLALADTEAADLTGPAAGHAIELTVKEMVLVQFAGTRDQPKGRAIHARAVLVAPSRPGRALAALADASVPVR